MRTLTVSLCLIAALVGPALAQDTPRERPAEKKTPQSQPAGKSKAAAPPARKRVITDLSGFDLLEPGKLRRQAVAVGATRSFEAPVAMAPKLGKLYASNPLFTWSYSGPAAKLVFVLWDDQQQELFRNEAAGEQYSYPAAAPRLRPGKTYFWTVEASSPALTASASAPAGILVVSGTQREEIEKGLAHIGSPGSYENALARAQLFTNHRLWYDALAAYSELIARSPDRAELYERRGTIYAQLPATRTLADHDFARAEQLQKALPPRR